MKKQKVKITWSDEKHDWCFFYLLRIKGTLVLLQGIDDPEDGSKHDGNKFWANSADIELMEVLE